jgi:hypothetical protein
MIGKVLLSLKYLEESIMLFDGKGKLAGIRDREE